MCEQKIYLVRHAESTLSGRYCGSTDSALSPTGVRQAKKIGRFFQANPFEICYLSDRKRVRQTAGFIAGVSGGVRGGDRAGGDRKGRSYDGTAFVCSRLLREIDFGDWEGLDYQSVSAQWPDLYSRWIKSPDKVNIPSGEPFHKFLKRIQTFSEKLLRSKSKSVAVLAHAGSISLLTLLLLKKPVKEFWKWLPSVGSISILKRTLSKKNGRFKVVSLKDVSHG